MALSLVCINIEGSKHLDRVLPFLKERQPDVVCVQELRQDDISRFEEVAGPLVAYEIMRYWQPALEPDGIGIFSKQHARDKKTTYYRKVSGELPPFDARSAETKYVSENIMFTRADFEKDGVLYRIGTTHFTWTPNGKSNAFQHADLEKLLPILEEAGEIVFCGDFNAPRGGEIFAELAKRYTDNIPEKYEWSLDLQLHRAGKAIPKDAQEMGLKGYMVDGLFSTPGYKVSDVELVNGLSDHCAVVATIEKS